MRRLCLSFATTAVLLLIYCCSDGQQHCSNFVTTHDGRFYRGETEYKFIGANFWYGAVLASEGQGGDRERLAKELDLMKEVGISNVRVLVGGEGPDTVASHVVPVLQPEPGVYNDTLLQGLDYLIAELEKREMTAVLFLNNSWEWSGGYGAYLEWAGCGPVPDWSDWDVAQRYHCQFVKNDKAKEMAENHVRFIVSRTNTVTGKPYTESPAIMAWELANEPRAFARDSVTKTCFANWIESQAKLIKSLDSNHLVQIIGDVFSPKQQITLCRDEADDYLLALAIEAKADYLVTGDQDLLVLQEVGTCRIVDAATFEQKI